MANPVMKIKGKGLPKLANKANYKFNSKYSQIVPST